MSLNSRDDQAKKTKATLPQAKASPHLASNQSEAPKKIKKEKKKKWQPKKRARKDPQEGSPVPVVSGSNAVQVTSGQKMKKA